MKAGRELDALVAVEIFGWERENESWYDEEGIEGTRFTSPDGIEMTAYGWGKDCEYDELDDRLPHYSTNISDTWLVVDKLKEKNIDIYIRTTVNNDWECDFVIEGNDYYNISKAAPLAICLAALQTVEIGI